MSSAATKPAPPQAPAVQPCVDKRIDVPKPLSGAQVKSFVDEGFLAVEGLVTMGEVEELRGDAVKLARGGYPCESLKAVETGLSDQEVLETILCIHQPHHISEVVMKYVMHPRVCGALSQIAAAHLPFWDGSVKCMQSMFFVKPPGFQGQAWHQDELYIPTRDRSLVGAWIALDDATVENGCLYVVPRSHRSGYLYPQKGHEKPDEFDFAPESYGFDDTAQVPVEVKAGTLVFFNGYLLHRSFRNRSKIFRRVLVNHYMNAWSVLPWQLKAGESAGTDRRVIVPVAGVDPYAWKGFEARGKDVYLRTCKAAKEALEARGMKK